MGERGNLLMWQEKDKQLYRIFKFKDFKTAFKFLIKVAQAAEEMKHHPTWSNTYDQVEIWLSTHAVGKITDKDRQLAAKIDRIYEDFKI